MYAITKSFVLSIISIYIYGFSNGTNELEIISMLCMQVLTMWVVISPYEIFDHIDLELYFNILYFCRLMFYINSAINPILYNTMSSRCQNNKRSSIWMCYDISSTGFGTDSGECSVAGNLCLTDEGPRPRATPPPPGATPTRTAADSFVWLHLFSDFQTVYRIKLKIIIKAGRKSYKVGNKGNKLLNVAHIKVS